MFINKNKSKKEEKIKISSFVTRALPFVDIKDDYIILKDEFMDILEIEGKALFSLNKAEIEKDVSIFHVFYKIISTDIKIVSMTFPVDATAQLSYVNYKRNKTNSKIYKSFLSDKENELKFLEQNRTNKEYYLFLFAKNLKILNSAKDTVKRTLPNAINIKDLTVKKKKLILHKLNNKNSKISIT
jgi:hypothetical protein